jgi:hypothetical protein
LPWPGGEALDERYFGLHHDMPPDAIAHQLNGNLIWRSDNQGMWVALIRFDRALDARVVREDRIPIRNSNE